jgi:hypothetical protein
MKFPERSQLSPPDDASGEQLIDLDMTRNHFCFGSVRVFVMFGTMLLETPALGFQHSDEITSFHFMSTVGNNVTQIYTQSKAIWMRLLTPPPSCVISQDMRPGKLLSFLLALFVLFSAVSGSAVFGVAQDASSAGCHESLTQDANPHFPTHDAGQNDDWQDAGGAQPLQHGCCVSVGLVPTESFFLPRQGERAAFVFRSSLHLATGVADIFHPPRQNA